jgi:glycosyltransferase involved in cell wall biosynthesis
MLSRRTPILVRRIYHVLRSLEALKPAVDRVAQGILSSRLRNAPSSAVTLVGPAPARQATVEGTSFAAEASTAAKPVPNGLRPMFKPSLYAELTGQDSADVEALWNHYLSHGLPLDIAPTPLFDPQHYAAQIAKHDLPPRVPDEPLVIHWLREGLRFGITPTPLFDEAFYTRNNPDVAKFDGPAFLHYVLHGVEEGRAPSMWFDQAWYETRPGNTTANRYDHFVALGAAQGLTPSLAVENIMRTFRVGTASTLAIYEGLMEASANWQQQVPANSLLLLPSLFVPQWHEPAATALDAFLDYLRDGLLVGRPPGPLFDPIVYARRATAASLPPPRPDENALVHWLIHGQDARIVPTDRFDEAFYRRANADIEATSIWGFAHFIAHGIYEGRAPSARPVFQRRKSATSHDASTMPSLYNAWHAADFPNHPGTYGDEIPAAFNDRLQRVLQSDWLVETFARAQAIDPAVGEIASINEFLLLPFCDGKDLIHAEISRRIPRAHYDSIVCVPWIRTGGADLVAGLLSKALLRLRPQERVLILRTDHPSFERANWLPGDADVVDISDLVRAMPPTEAEHMLRLIFRGLTARRVFNVNSRLCWTTMRRYGSNLAATLNTYAYMFCWDQTPSGLRAGYPAEFFAETAANMTAFLTDTRYLRQELTTMYRLPAAVSDRIVPLHTPALAPVLTPSIARRVLTNGHSQSRRLVLWAGRLDRQKRFDLVQDIASRMPDVEFRCWGAALLDAPPDLTRLPLNVVMQGGFDSFDDLPLAEAGAWLFTALWEGMPTTIIELATRGVAIVASAVGGIPELIQPETGWPVKADATVEDYVAELRTALDSPEDAMRRAEALQARVNSRYTEAMYDTDLGRLLAAETGA